MFWTSLAYLVVGLAYENTPLPTPSIVAIEVTELSRVFAVQQNRGWNRAFKPKTQITALEPVSCSIPTGQRCAVSGRNGSGKSTFLKILAGVIHPTSGTAQSLGYVPWKRQAEYLRRVGVMFGQKSMLFGDLTLTDALELYRPLYRLDHQTLTESLEELDSYFHQRSIQDIPVRKMSLGQRITCEVVAALFHQPELLILDEPTIGMDFHTRDRLATYLNDKTESLDGTPRTLLLTTHDVEFAQQTCQYTLSLHRGSAPTHTPLSKNPTASPQKYLTLRYIGTTPDLSKIPGVHDAHGVSVATVGYAAQEKGREVHELHCHGVHELDGAQCELLLNIPGVQELVWRVAHSADESGQVGAE